MSPFGAREVPSTASVNKQNPFKSQRSDNAHTSHNEEPTESEAVSITVQSIKDTSHVSSILRVGGGVHDDSVKPHTHHKVYFEKSADSIFNDEARMMVSESAAAGDDAHVSRFTPDINEEKNDEGAFPSLVKKTSYSALDVLKTDKDLNEPSS